ncbi:uncharacterized protein LOC144439242 [Glandiceps talaboti]
MSGKGKGSGAKTRSQRVDSTSSSLEREHGTQVRGPGDNSINANEATTVDEKVDLILSKLRILDVTEAQQVGLSQDFKALERKVTELQTSTEFCHHQVEEMTEKVLRNEDELVKLRLRNTELDDYIRRENLRFFGIQEEEKEDTEQVLRNFISRELEIDAQKIEFQRVHRTRATRKGKPRGIIARFLRFKDREAVRRAGRKLEGKPFSIREDFSQPTLEKRRKLIPVMKRFREENKRAVLVADKLFVDGNRYEPLRHFNTEINESIRETWMTPQVNIDIPGFTYHINSRKQKHARAKRESGGLLVLIRDCLVKCIDIIENDVEDMIWMRLKAGKCGLIQDVYICGIYVAPENSTIYRNRDQDQFELLERFVANFYNKGDIIICGDLNARTGELPDFVVSDSANHIPLPSYYEVDETSVLRKNMDKKVNRFGERLIELCLQSKLRIANGRLGNDLDGNFTCYQPRREIEDTNSNFRGMSTVDYVLASETILPEICEFTTHDLTIHSDHVPLSFTISGSSEYRMSFQHCNVNSAQVNPNVEHLAFCWKEDSRESFVNELNLNKSATFMHAYLNTSYDPDVQGVELATESLLTFLQGTAKNCLSSKLRFGKKREKVNQNRKSWFDNECKSARDRFKHVCKKFRSPTRLKEQEYLNARNSYRKLKRKKKYMAKLKTLADLENSCTTNRNTDKFWAKLKQMQETRSGKPKHISSKITGDQWFEYFTNLAQPPVSNCFDENFHAGVNKELSDFLSHEPHNNDLLDRQITDVELEKALSVLKNSKQPGTDAILNEMLKASNADNQSGFRKYHSTVDNILILKTLIEKMRVEKKKLYVCFIDFQKAFDYVDRAGLFVKLIKSGIKGKFMKVLISMYNSVKYTVKLPGGLSTSFKSDVGVQQGGILSPILFAFFLNDVEDCLNRPPFQGITLGDYNLSCLLYADDSIIVSTSRQGLELLLSRFENYCNSWRLLVNVVKTQVVVFNRDLFSNENDQTDFVFNGQGIKTVTRYTYLGIVFTENGSFKAAFKQLADKASKTIFSVRAALGNELSPKLYMKIFDTKILPILNYAAAVLGNLHVNLLENIQIKWAKFILGVPQHTTNAAILAELGRYPVELGRQLDIIRFWHRTSKLPFDRLSHKALNDVITLGESGKSKWARSIKGVIFNACDQGTLWSNPLSICIGKCISERVQSLKGEYFCEWKKQVFDDNRRNPTQRNKLRTDKSRVE